MTTTADPIGRRPAGPCATSRTIEELDLHYGKPERLASVTAVLGMSSNRHHDQTSVEVITERGQRLLLGFTQSALRELVFLCQSEVQAPDKPKAN